MRTILLLFSLCAGMSTQAATYVAASTALADVQAAVALAVTGDTVEIPAGSSTWANRLVIDGKALWLKGAGTNETFITIGLTGLSSQHFINFTGTHTDLVRVSDFTIIGATTSLTSLLSIGSTTTTNIARVHDMVFTNLLGKAGISLAGWSPSLVDRCAFYATTGTGVRAYGEGAYSWDTRARTIGTTNAVVVENCVFSWGANANGAIDGYNGVRYTMRFNTITNVNVGHHGTDSGNLRGTHTYEIYGNTFVNTGGMQDYLGSRSGSGIWASNILTGNIRTNINLKSYRSSGTNIYGGTVACCNPWGPINGANVLDGNVDEYGYPAYDGIGRTGPTQYFPSTPATNGIATGYTVQVSAPTYQWANLVNGNPMSFLVPGYNNTGEYASITHATNLVQEGRDYINGVDPGWTPLAYPHPLIAALEGGGEPEPEPPTIVTHPESQAITSGSTANLSVAATGTAPFTYQWYSGESPDTSNPISGATSGSYTTPALSSIAEYWVRVTNSEGTADSNTSYITLIEGGGENPPAASVDLITTPEIRATRIRAN